MSAFDPYYKWLGISPKDQPPNHYRLLGIDEFEVDPDVIAAAADRQMTYVRQCASGEHADDSQRLLGELATARLDLLNSQKKAEYDARLRSQRRPILPTFRLSWLWSVLLLSGATSLVAVVVWIATNPAVVGKPPDDAPDSQLTDVPDPNGGERQLASATPEPLGEQAAESKPPEPKLAKSMPDDSKTGEPTPVESKPTEPTSVESKPVESKPAEPDSKNSPITTAPPVNLPAGRTRADLNGRVAGEEWDGNGLKIRFCWCPPGAFTMGSPPSEKGRWPIEDQARVRLTDGFWLGRFEVTRSVWLQVMRTSPWMREEQAAQRTSAMRKESADYPATFVSWEDATEFCSKLTARERGIDRLPAGWRYDLPTEAQWEYACRAGTETKYSYGEDPSQLGEYAWFGETTSAIGEAYAHPVGQKKPNAWGLQDMHGNVWEWCRDSYQENLLGGSNPFVNTSGRNRAMRGGGWNDPPASCRSAYRDFGSPRSITNHLGFRVAIVHVSIVRTGN